VIWTLGILGILLLLLGIWGGPARLRRRRDADVAAKKETQPGEAWEILARPLEDEAIKIPEHRPWYAPGGDRRFQRGLLVGLGAGLMVAAVAVSSMPRGTADQAPGTAWNTPAPQGGQPAAGTGQQAGQGAGTTAAPAAEPPKAANKTFTVEEGWPAVTIGAELQKQGLIADANAFVARVVERGVDVSLKAGTFVVPTNATLDQVIDSLITTGS
jgi:hypothetical protein